MHFVMYTSIIYIIVLYAGTVWLVYGDGLGRGGRSDARSGELNFFCDGASFFYSYVISRHLIIAIALAFAGTFYPPYTLSA